MSKSLLVLLLVVFACFSMRINHFEDEQPAVEPTADPAAEPADPYNLFYL